MMTTLLIGLLLTSPGLHPSASQRVAAVEPNFESGSEEAVGLPPHRPSFGRFVTDLAKSSARLVSPDNLAPLLLGVGTTAATHTADPAVQEYFAKANRLGGLTRVGTEVGETPLLFGVVGGLWSLSHFFGSETFVLFSHDLAQASALNGLLTQGLKHGIARTRPDGTNKVSLPSGHSSSTFAAATVINHHFGATPSILAYVGASVLAATRLDADKHYLSDVVAGAALGHIVGRTVTRARTRSTTQVRWIPLLAPETETVGVVVSWEFDR